MMIPLIMMSAVTGDELDSSVEEEYLNVINKFSSTPTSVSRIDRFSLL